jgi:hypothetical protein
MSFYKILCLFLNIGVLNRYVCPDSILNFYLNWLFLHGFSGVRVTRSLVSCVCFVDRCLSFCTFSFRHCVVCSSSIDGFWYLQTLLKFSCHISDTHKGCLILNRAELVYLRGDSTNNWIPVVSIKTQICMLCLVMIFWNSQWLKQIKHIIILL